MKDLCSLRALDFLLNCYIQIVQTWLRCFIPVVLRVLYCSTSDFKLKHGELCPYEWLSSDVIYETIEGFWINAVNLAEFSHSNTHSWSLSLSMNEQLIVE